MPPLAQDALEDERWRAVRGRDPLSDGRFVYAVTTTGIYCNPSCSSRHAKRENVRFYKTPAQAEAEGFRACHRCRPTEAPQHQRDSELVTKLCRYIESCEVMPSLTELAALAELSTSHTRRLFRSVTGLTPKEYATSQLRKRVQDALDANHNVTEAIFEAGYSSTSRFYEASQRMLGMTATEWRTGAPDLEIRFAVGDCSLGAVLVAATTVGVCAVLLGSDPDALIDDLTKKFPKAKIVGGDEHFDAVAAAVIAVVESPGQPHTLPLDVRGTAFQQRVWKALQNIPAGTVATYSEVAKAIGAPSSVRAVAGACGANALAVLIPCHRVVRKGGALSGYRWGVERKKALIAEEAASKAQSGV